MKSLTFSPILPVLAVLITGCDTPASPELPIVTLHSALQRCHSVHGSIAAQAFPGGALGTIRGDIEGSIVTVTEPDPAGNSGVWPTGRQFRRVGHQTVEVTGGSIPDLEGSTLVWAIDSRAAWVSSSLPRVSNTLTIVEGATGHLTSHGILSAVTLVTNFDYEGEICLRELGVAAKSSCRYGTSQARDGQTARGVGGWRSNADAPRPGMPVRKSKPTRRG
jgi:hypothetical protein